MKPYCFIIHTQSYTNLNVGKTIAYRNIQLLSWSTDDIKRNDDGIAQYWWSHHYSDALSACVIYERCNFLKAVVQDHEFHESLRKVQDSKPKFKVKINCSKSKTKRRKHYEKWNKKKQRGGPKQC